MRWLATPFSFIAAMLAGWLSLRALAPQFVWGEGHESRPILLLVAALLAQWVLLGWMAYAVSFTSWKLRPRLAIAAGVVFHLVMLGSNPIQEHDAYRYLWDGATMAAGVSPYRYTPKQILDGVPSSDRYDASRLQALASDDAHAVENLQKVGYPEVPTIYPPAAQVIFMLGYQTAGWSWDGLRLIFIGAYFGGAVLVLRALKVSGADRRSEWIATLLLAFSPLAVKEVANSAHLDALLVLIFGAIVLLIAKAARLGQHRVTAGVAILVALAVLTKLYPLLLLPVFLAWLAGRYSWHAAAACAVGTTAIICAAYAPFLAADGVGVFRGLFTFTDEWERNSGAFAFLQSFFEQILGTSPVALSFTVGGHGSAGIVATKLVAQVLLLIVIAFQCVRVYRSGRADDHGVELSRSCAIVLLIWFLLLPMAFPWYLLGVIPFALHARFGVMPWMLMASVGSFYYALFYVEYHDLPALAGICVRCVEYGIPAAFLAASYLQNNERGRRLVETCSSGSAS